MPDLLHPATPIVPSAPAEPVAPAQALSDPYNGPYMIDRAALLELGCWPILRATPAPAAWPFPVDMAEPDPAPVGDPFPQHLIDAPLQAPLPPVLREDRAPAGSLLDALGPWLEADDEVVRPEPARVMLNVPDGQGWQPYDPARLAAWRAKFDAPRPNFLRRLWADYHEWITVGLILVAAAAVVLSTRPAHAAVVVVPARVVVMPRPVVTPRPAPAVAKPAPRPAEPARPAPSAPLSWSIWPWIGAPAAPACTDERRARREC